MLHAAWGIHLLSFMNEWLLGFVLNGGGQSPSCFPGWIGMVVCGQDEDFSGRSDVDPHAMNIKAPLQHGEKG